MQSSQAPRRALLALIVIFGVLPPALAAETVRSTATAPAAVSVPYTGKGTPRVFARSATGKWQQAAVKLQEGRLLFELDPAKLGSAEITLLIDPPPGLVMDDYAGPAVTALAVDGQALPAGLASDLGRVNVPPRTLTVTFKDALNALDPDGYRILVDERPVAVRRPWLRSHSASETTLRVRLPQLDYGQHELAVSARDTSPQANATTVRVRLNYLESGNVALAALGAKITVDSSFSGYESLVALNDGVTVMPGDHCGNDLSWASAEVAMDHWAEVTFPKPTPIKEVTIYWAAYTNVSHTPRHFEIQIPEGAGWKTLYQSPAEGEQPSPMTTARFETVTTSQFRIFVPTGEGSVARPNLLWIGEIKAR